MSDTAEKTPATKAPARSRTRGAAKPAPPEPARTPSLGEKLLEVALEIDHVEKGGRNTAQNYDYVEAADVFRVMRAALLSRGVLVIPGAFDPELTTWQSRSGATTILTTLRLQYRFLDVATGDEIVVPWVAQGVDTGGDKGIWKAYTGGLKYALIQTFLVPMGEDPEADRMTQAPQAQQQPARPAVQTIPRERAERIVRDAGAAGMTELVFKAKLSELGFERVVDLTVDAAESLQAWIAAEAKSGASS